MISTLKLRNIVLFHSTFMHISCIWMNIDTLNMMQDSFDEEVSWIMLCTANSLFCTMLLIMKFSNSGFFNSQINIWLYKTEIHTEHDFWKLRYFFRMTKFVEHKKFFLTVEKALLYQYLKRKTISVASITLWISKLLAYLQNEPISRYS